MIRTILTFISFLATTMLFAQNDAWSKVTDWDKYCEEEDLEKIEAYLLIDIDDDGTKEAFVRDEVGNLGFLTCGGGDIKCVASTIYTTSLYYTPGQPYVFDIGSCGSGCANTSIFKIEKSKHVNTLLDIAYYSTDDEEKHECSSFKNGEEKEISYTLFKKLAPKTSGNVAISEMDWTPIKSTVSASANSSNAVEATLHSTSGDTVILKDKSGYLYQIMSDGKLGVAPGGAYSGDIVIPSSIKYNGDLYTVTTVRRGAFYKRAETNNIGVITTITLPETVTLVGSDAFRGNNSLTAVNYGKNTRIEVRSFWGCPKLKVASKDPIFAFTEGVYQDENGNNSAAKNILSTYYYPIEEKDGNVEDYRWAFFKYNHSGINFSKWINFNKERAMACYCGNIDFVKGGVFKLKDSNNVESMFKGYMDSGAEVMIADNGYVARHEFPMFSRWVFGEERKSAPQSFTQQMQKKYGKKIKYSYEVGKLLYSTNEQLIITEFEITNHVAHIVLSWIKDGKEICSYEQKNNTDPEYEEYGVWNVDDDGEYGIPHIMTIGRDENGNIELFLIHFAPESINFSHLKQSGSKFIEAGSEQWYNWIDPN